MPSEPPTGPTPPPLIYPSPAERVGYRWGTGIIALIVAVILLIAVGITAAIVWNRGPGETKPQPGVTVPTTNPAPSTQPGTGQPPARINIGDVPFTPAPGWVIVEAYPSAVTLINKDDTALLHVEIAEIAGDFTDVTQALSFWITMWPSLTNVDIQLGKPEKLQSNRFQLAQTANYSAAMSTNQGTKPIYGMFAVLLNTSTGKVAGINYFAFSPDAFQASGPDTQTMIASML